MRVLIVEDSSDARFLYRQALEIEDHEVVEADDAEGALDLLRQVPLPDAILLDLTLPRMSGDQFMKNLKADPTWSRIPVIIVSGWDDLKQRAAAMGAAGHLRKPFDLVSLRNALTQVMA